MSKIRIYELAKELGVDNKVIITKATDLGMHGKKSHSSSLEGDEADQIRRAVIRQAVGATGGADKPVTGFNKEGASVERIKAGVIRRRKESPRADEHTVELSEVTADVPVETEQEPLGNPPSVEEPASVSTEIVAEQAESVATPVELPVEPVVVEQVIEQVVEEAPESAPVVEAAPVEAPSVTPASTQGSAAVAATPASNPFPVAARKIVGPKILGKIELAPPVVKKPVAKPAPKPESRWGSAPTGRSDAPVAPGEAGKPGGDWKKGKKSKRREISRLELLDYEGMEPRRGGKGGHRKNRDDQQQFNDAANDPSKAKPQHKVVTIGEVISVGELARGMSLKSGEVIAKFLEMGIMVTINQAVDHETASVIAQEFGFEVLSSKFEESDFMEKVEVSDDPGKLEARPPVVTVMGHVDHGKTTLLDAIRNTTVAAGEAGGITQHIGAYQVTLDNGKLITFIDTPGHAAFTAMRARGANVTDVVVLVVGADDGVMPQTIEAINHAKAAEVPIIVAVNKIDRPEAKPDNIKNQLAEHGLIPEDWGGTTMYFPVSALKKIGIKELLEGVLLVSEVEELKANPSARARGAIVEARQDKGRGIVATALIQSGTLNVGDYFVCGFEDGRVRSMTDHLGKRLKSAGPSTPVEITGLNGVAMAGDDFFVVESEADAREVIANRQQKKLQKEQRLVGGPLSLEEFARRANNLAAAELNVIVKADVHGSLEAIRDSLEKLSTDKVRVRVIHSGIGGITESDIQLAVASKAIVLGFGVRAEPRALADAEAAGIELRFYRIIYELLDEIKKAMTGLLAPVKKEVRLGRVEVRQTFSVPKAGVIAGCFVSDGMVKRSAMVRVVRDSKVVYEGKMGSLRRFKDDASEVQTGYECGIGLEKFNDVRPGDIYEIFEVRESAATLDG